MGTGERIVLGVLLASVITSDSIKISSCFLNLKGRATAERQEKRVSLLGFCEVSR